MDKACRETLGGLRRSVAAAYPKPLAKALALLRDPASLTLSVRDMANRAGVSEPYLYALFKRHLGASPHQHLLNCRLRLARIRLAGSDDKGVAHGLVGVISIHAPLAGSDIRFH